jgi:hypothetical protein
VAGQLLTYQAGRIRPSAPVKAYQSREDWLADLEAQRRDGVLRRRAYYEGTQYEEANAQCLRDMAGAGGESEKQLARAMAIWNQQLPEHLRLHAYSSQILEALDFVTNRLAGGFQVKVEDASAKTVVDRALDASPELAGTQDDDNLTVDGVTRETLIAGDTPALLRWDRIAGTVWVEFWDSEMVEMRFVNNRPDVLEKVIVEEVTWRVPPGEEKEKQVTIRRVWQVDPFRVTNLDEVQALGAVPQSRRECVEEVWLLNEQGKQEILLDTIGWGVPFLPWQPIRAGKKSLRATRGESMISELAMRTADRYNANEQVGWLIARYNSHANLAVSGDAAILNTEHAKRIAKDVADVLTFPGATQVDVITLPTDPQMIEHQKEVLTDSLYGCMGVTRVDQTSLEGLGGVTGYALEILNQKSDGTFSQLRQKLILDWKRLINLVLDCHSYWSRTTATDLVPEVSLFAQIDLAEGMEEEVPGYDDINPLVDFPNRAVTIEMGSGYVVDDVKIRDDFAAKLISQQEALRQRGLPDERIKEIMDEMQQAAADALAAQQAAFNTNTEGTAGPGSSGRNQAQSGSATNSTARAPRAVAS